MAVDQIEVPADSRAQGHLAVFYRALEWILPVVFTAAGIALYTSGVRQRLAELLPYWKNIALLAEVLFLAGIGFVAQTVFLRRTVVEHASQLTLRLLSMTLIVLIAAVLVVLWKYLYWYIPDTWTAQAIYLDATQPGSLVDLYSARQLEAPPFLTPLYPPGYFAFTRIALALFGNSPSALRILSVIAIAGTAAALLVASKQRAGDRWSLLAPAVFLAFFPVVTWSGPPTKPEYVACAFVVMGFAVYLRKGFGSSARWAPLSAVLFSVAILVKYTLIGAFVTVAIHLLLRREFRASGIFLLTSVVIVGGVYATFAYFTDGGVTLFTIQANAAKPDFVRLIRAGMLGILPNAYVILAVGAAYVLALRAERVGSPDTAVAISVLLSLAISVLAMGRPGSSANYFLEPVVLGALAIALVVRRSFEEGSKGSATLFPCAALLVLALVQVPWQFALVARSEGNVDEQAEVRSRLAELRPAADEYVMADALYVFDVVEAGYKPVIIDNFFYTLMYDNGLIDVRRLLDVFEAGKVPYLVLEGTLDWHASLGYGARYFPPEVVAYLKRNYTCQTVMKRWDQTSLVICNRLIASTSH